MYRPIMLLLLFLPATLLYVRARTSPVFLDGPSYVALQSWNLSATTAIIAQIFLLALLIILILYIIKTSALPQETLFVLAASPPLIVTLVTAGPAILLGIVGVAIVAFWKRSLVLAVFGILAIVAHPTGILLSVIVLVALIIRKHTIPAILLALGGSLLIAVQPLEFTAVAPFSELGALGGMSIFILLLALTGMLAAWNTHTYPHLVALITLIIVSLFVHELRIVGALAAAGLAGIALSALRTRTWSLESIRSISILLVACGLLYAAASTGAQAIRYDPQPSLFALRDLHQALPEGETLAHPEHQAMLAWHGVLTTDTYLEEILESRNYDVSGPLIPTYVLLHAEDPAPNLRFLIENTDNFHVIYEGDFTLWEHHP